MKEKTILRFHLLLLLLTTLANNTFAQYCTPLYSTSSCVSNDYIDSIAIHTLTNGSTGCATNGANYSDFTSMSVNLNTGSTYNVAILPTALFAEAITIFIDFDQNNVFDATEQVFFHAASNALMTGSIVIPSNALAGSTRMRIRSVYNATTSADPCISYTYGETEDYTINIVAGINCAGLPAASNTLASDDSVCIGEIINLSMDFTYSGVGISYQWQSSANGSTWTNITNATNPILNQTISAASYYQCIVSCVNGGSITSTPIAIHLNPYLTCYCAAYNPPCSGLDYISNVSIGSTALNNTSACSTNPASNYTNYDGIIAAANLTQGISYPLNVTTEDDHIISVWIDYDHNGVYDASEWTQVATTTVPSVGNSINLVVPTNAMLGQTMMRMRARLANNQNGASDACLSMGSGETEDYAINIMAGTACNGTPANTNIVSSVPSACLNQPFDLSLSTVYTTVGLTYQWQSSINNITWTNIMGANTNQLTTMQSVATYYRCTIDCNGNSITSAPIMIAMNSFMNCYCTPVYTNASCASGDYIDSVYLNTISNGLTGCAVTTDNYSDYKNLNTVLLLGSSYNIAVLPENVFGQAVTVFIDFNHDAVFDPATEQVFSLPTSTSLQMGTISIPNTASLGATVMRVRCSYNQLLALDPCDDEAFGETEDYTVILQNAGANPNIAVTNVAAPANDCEHTANEMVHVTITNVGSTTLNPSDVAVNLNLTGTNLSSYQMMNTTTLAPNASETLTFSPVNLLNIGLTTLAATATLNNDVDINDNTTTTNTVSYGADSVSQAITLCQGNSIMVGSNTYNATGIYIDNLTSITGCDSIVTTNLTITPPSIDSSYHTICEGNLINVNGTLYYPANDTIFNFITQNAQGCDEINYIFVTVNPLPVVALPDTVIGCGCQTLTAPSGFIYQWCNGANTQSIDLCSNTICNVTIIDANGCMATSEPTNVIILNTLNASASYQVGGAGYVYHDAIAIGDAPITYTWDFGDGTTSNQQNPLHQYPGAIFYNVMLTVNSACGDTIIYLQVFPDYSGIEVQILQGNLSIYPNPNKGTFIVSSTDIVADKVSIELLDIQGKSLYKGEEMINDGFTHQVQVANLAKGIYLLKVSDGIGVAVQKIMIE